VTNLPAPNPGRFGVATPGYAIPTPPGQYSAPPVRKRLRPRTFVGIVVVAVILVAAISYAFYRFGHDSVAKPTTQTLLVTTRPLPEGSRIVPADVRAVTVQTGHNQPATAGLGPNNLAKINGQVANQAIPAGTILTMAEVAPTGAVPNGDQTLVGLNLKPNQVPQNGLAVGERVGVINVPTAPSQGTPPTPIPLTTAAVWNITTDQAGNTSCEITVPNTLAATIAADSDRQQVILVRLSPDAPFPPE
jgi:hypothetical protein